MRGMKWFCVVGLAVLASLAMGCATDSTSLPRDASSSKEREKHPRMMSRGVVQVQRQKVDASRSPVGDPITVAYMVCDPNNNDHQWWLSAEDLPIQPKVVSNMVDSIVVLSPDGDHECMGEAGFRAHMQLPVHAEWIQNHAGGLRFFTFTEDPAVAPWTGQ